MKKRICLYPFLVLLFLATTAVYLFSTPTRIAPVGNPTVVMEVLDPTLEQFAPAWRVEIARRVPNAVGILVHGGAFVQNEWIAGAGYAGHITLTTEIVKHYRDVYPDRVLVLLACNPGHLKLGIPGVYYSMSNVWCVPDRGVSPDKAKYSVVNRKLGDFEFRDLYQLEDGVSRSQSEPDVVGNIYEFVRE